LAMNHQLDHHQLHHNHHSVQHKKNPITHNYCKFKCYFVLSSLQALFTQITSTNVTYYFQNPLFYIISCYDNLGTGANKWKKHQQERFTVMLLRPVPIYESIDNLGALPHVL
jgi:hypothetical protein